MTSSKQRTVCSYRWREVRDLYEKRGSGYWVREAKGEASEDGGQEFMMEGIERRDWSLRTGLVG